MWFELGFHSAFRRPAIAEVGRTRGGCKTEGGRWPGDHDLGPCYSPPSPPGLKGSAPPSQNPFRSGGPHGVPRASWQGLHELCPPHREKHRELSAGAETGSACIGPGEGRSLPAGLSQWPELCFGVLWVGPHPPGALALTALPSLCLCLQPPRTRWPSSCRCCGTSRKPTALARPACRPRSPATPGHCRREACPPPTCALAEPPARCLETPGALSALHSHSWGSRA